MAFQVRQWPRCPEHRRPLDALQVRGDLAEFLQGNLTFTLRGTQFTDKLLLVYLRLSLRCMQIDNQALLFAFCVTLCGAQGVDQALLVVLCCGPCRIKHVCQALFLVMSLPGRVDESIELCLVFNAGALY